MMDHNSNRHSQLDELVRRVRSQAGLGAAFAGTIDPAAGGYQITHVIGRRMGSLLNLAVDVGAGVGGKALILAKPVGVSDYSRADGITHHYDSRVAPTGLRSIFAVPAMVGGAPRAMVYGALHHPVEISDVRLSIVRRLVRQVELDFRIEDEVRRRLAELDNTSRMTRMREELREIYCETRAVASRIADPELKARMVALSERARAQATEGDAGSKRLRNRLTKREVDVAAQVSAGHTNAEVAARLGLVESTVKAYLKSAMRKLEVRNRVELVAACRRAGLIA